MTVICGNDRHIIVTRKIDKPFVDDFLFRDAIVLKLKIESVAENGEIFVHKGIDMGFVVFQDCVGYFTFKTGGETDETFIILPEYLLVDAGNVVETLGMRETYKLEKVSVSAVIHCEEDDVVRVVFTFYFFLIET